MPGEFVGNSYKCACDPTCPMAVSVSAAEGRAILSITHRDADGRIDRVDAVTLNRETAEGLRDSLGVAYGLIDSTNEQESEQ